MLSRDTFTDAVRSNTGLLAAVEKRVLLWLAGRVPPAINPDHLTALAFAAMAMVGASFALSTRFPVMLALAPLCLAINWLGDSLDGTIARVRNQRRPRYGFYVDHLLDSFGALFVLTGLACSGRMTPLMAAAVLIAYFVVSIEAYLATYCLGRFEMAQWKMGPTELRIVLAIGAVALYAKSSIVVFGRQYLMFDIGGLVGAAGMIATAIVSGARHTALLYAAEPLVRPAALKVLDDVGDHALRVAKEH